MSREADIAARLGEVTRRVEEACRRGGRDPGEVTLVAITKKQPPEVIDAAASAGIRHVGENYVQELTAKRSAVKTQPAWHFVGHLQRNKAKYLAGEVALVHAVDSEPLARELSRRAARAGAVQPILVAVNVGGEAQKSGVAPGELAALLAAVAELPGVRCDGLMTMPPMAGAAEDSRPYVRALRELRDRHRSEASPLPELSMGTSSDYEVAVEEGATLVRVGTAVVGPRPPG